MDIREHFGNKKLHKVLSKSLTAQEVRVLKLFATGSTVNEITEILTVSEGTVRTHIRNIFAKIIIGNSADCKITLCLFWQLYRHELEKKEGIKKCKRN